MRRIYILLLCCFPLPAMAQVWQWSCVVDSTRSSETNDCPQAFLWIPENCKQLKAVVFAQHNMTEETMLEHPEFRKTLAELGIGEVWVTPAISQMFDFNSNDPTYFQHIMDKLADLSGYGELASAPVIPIGHSALASFPWNFAAWNPGRTLALISLHGDAPLTPLTGSGRPNPNWHGRNINGVPSLFIMGEYEWWEDRVSPAFDFIQSNQLSVITLFADAGHGHFDASDELTRYVCLFLRKAMRYRWQKNGLRALRPQSGWLADRWRKDSLPAAPAAPYNRYRGDKRYAAWVFDREMAEATEAFYNAARGKQRQFIGFIQDGKVLKPNNTHAVFTAAFRPGNDGITFHLQAFFSDSTHLAPAQATASGLLEINRICGPVKKIDDTTFVLDFYRMGLNNAKRSNDIWLLASNKGDDRFKSIVQQVNIKIPLPLKNGEAQEISFEELPDQQPGAGSIPLSAQASSGLPVSYYVKEGPAYVKDNRLYFTALPPRARLPVKVTVVAWQYGINGIFKSALPVSRSFYIRR
ncbi:hypothetical protein J2T02_002376 [Chitinophaga terrae (ex Kim and Jung 2007)]|uniref:hypothetical protein n=1 Tax=Chitinophaga terrae (ex Kim and Jung 2007) TaxID=408074 RepID=UPI00277D53DD|nr:hypothetical protein [Chitinophaga terrae (ex Kim and Jung 2007)]MDQ0107259.1 hypothetical protein [Chitinophaga terrae (ex Kim and Jung 2007)]